MEIQELVNEGIQKEYKIILPFELLDGKINAFIQQKGKTYKMDGFRPGKVPFQQLHKIFYPEALQHAVDQCVQDASQQFFKEKQLKPAMRPDVELLKLPTKSDEPLELKISFEVLPEVPDVSYEGLSLIEYEVDIPQERIDEHLKELAKSKRDTKPLEKPRPAKVGDTVFVDLNLKEKPKDSPLSFEHFPIYLSKTGEASDFEEKLFNANEGDVIEQKIKFPKDFPDKNFAKKSFYTTMHVKEIRETVPFEINQAFAKHMGFETLDELRQQEAKNFEKYTKDLVFLSLKRQVLDYFAKHYPFDVPLKMQDVEFQSIWESAMEDLGLSGDLEKKPHQHVGEDPHDHSQCHLETAQEKEKRQKIIEKETGKTEAQLRELYQKVAARRVRLGLMFAKIGEAQKITVSKEELNHLVKAQIQKYPGKEKDVIAFYQKNPQALVNLQGPLYEQKVIEWVMGQVPKTQEKIPLQKLEDMLENDDF